MFFEFGTYNAVPTKPAIAIGRLMRKTDPHQKCASKRPPRMGPSATPMPVVADQIPIARARSRSVVKTFVRIDNVQGMSAAAPTPITARAVVKTSGLFDKAAKADPAPKITSPAINTHLRPT
jgi:hypothetical protein